jgi:hypothetical protein
MLIVGAALVVVVVVDVVVVVEGRIVSCLTLVAWRAWVPAPVVVAPAHGEVPTTTASTAPTPPASSLLSTREL